MKAEQKIGNLKQLLAKLNAEAYTIEIKKQEARIKMDEIELAMGDLNLEQRKLELQRMRVTSSINELERKEWECCSQKPEKDCPGCKNK